MPKKTKCQVLREDIGRDLLDQLERNGTVGSYYTDLVDDYLSLWDTKNKLIADIKARGVAVQGAQGTKKNDSVGELVKLNAQMLKLLDSIGIKPAQADGGDEGDEM